MAAVDEFADRDVRGMLHRGWLLLLPLGDRGLFPRFEEWLQDRRVAVRACRPDAGVLGDVHDRGVAGAVCVDLGKEMPGVELRGGVLGRGMEIGVRDCQPYARAEKTADAGGDDPDDRRDGRLLRAQRRWPPWSANDVDRHAANAGL